MGYSVRKESKLFKGYKRGREGACFFNAQYFRVPHILVRLFAPETARKRGFDSDMGLAPLFFAKRAYANFFKNYEHTENFCALPLNFFLDLI